MSPEPKSITGRRTVCDHCRRRRIRCDGEFPCSQCYGASLSCKREHVPKRRGPKKGSGRVINALRAQDEGGKFQEPESNKTSVTGGSQSSGPPSIEQWIHDSANASTSPTTEHQRWHPIMTETSSAYANEPSSIFTSDQFRPTSPSYFHLIPTCLDLFMEHIYPIMPLIHMPSLRASISRPLEMFEKNLLYSLCALTSTHMSGKSILAPGPPSWEAAGRFFLDECISVRQSYDFVEDKTLSAVISSYFVSTAFFELNQNRKSWYYLREALTMGQDLGFHDEETYTGLNEAEALCRRRTFWILYVTERSFAILRHKPLTLQKTPNFPTTLHSYEPPSIHTGFISLINSYHLLDSSFVNAWNESSSTPLATSTYTTLQNQLLLPPTSTTSSEISSIQKADLLVTQQWLRLIVWQSSMRQGLLSSTSPEESMTFAYPLKIAHSLLNVITSLPTSSIEVHGMGMFEKIFEIGNTMLDVLQACGNNISLENSLGAYGVVQDPFEIFIKTLSQTPNSQRQYANLLLAKAAEKPEIQRFSLHPENSLQNDLPSPTPTFTLAGGGGGGGLGNAYNLGLIENPNLSSNTGGGGGGGLSPTTSSVHTDDTFLSPQQQQQQQQQQTVPRQWRGSIVGEINDDGIYQSHDPSQDDVWKVQAEYTTEQQTQLRSEPSWNSAAESRDVVWMTEEGSDDDESRIGGLGIGPQTAWVNVE